MKNFSYVLLLGIFYIPTSFADISAKNSTQKNSDQEITVQKSSHPGELRKCTDLLPAGHKYTISIIGTSDKTTHSAEGKFTGEFKVSNDVKHDVNKETAEEIKPFVQCVTERVL
ncbi:hypothetical protein ABLB69_09915 [Xenorhabdus khoisanae]|uniref:hypothetical protein n=1 Tax=Xenorhabdus khoisanae TaxID=880157 RepID=UPI0032B7F086